MIELIRSDHKWIYFSIFFPSFSSSSSSCRSSTLSLTFYEKKVHQNNAVVCQQNAQKTATSRCGRLRDENYSSVKALSRGRPAWWLGTFVIQAPTKPFNLSSWKGKLHHEKKNCLEKNFLSEKLNFDSSELFFSFKSFPLIQLSSFYCFWYFC